MKIYWRSLKEGKAQHCWRDSSDSIFITSSCGITKLRSKLSYPNEVPPRCKNCERALKE